MVSDVFWSFLNVLAFNKDFNLAKAELLTRHGNLQIRGDFALSIIILYTSK